jgi:hypothetical protein
MSINMNAQIGVGPIEYVKTKSGKFSVEEIASFKSTYTIFVCRDQDDRELLEIELKKIWNITPIKVVKYSEFIDIEEDGKSYFTISYFTRYSESNNIYSTHFYLNLWMNERSEKGKIRQKSYARIELFPNFKDSDERIKTKYTKDYLYNESNFYNWNVGLIRTYIGIVNNLLKIGEERWLYESEFEKKLGQLKDETLYIPSYIIESFQGDENELFKDYDYNYEVLNNSQLNEIISTSKKSVYFLVYVVSSTDKYINVYDSNPPNILYSKYKGLSYKLKSSDLKDLNNKIHSASKK